MRIAILAAACLAAAASSSAADARGEEPAPAAAPAPAAPAEDVIVLADGTEVRGRITAEDGEAYAVKVGGALRLVDKKTVKEVRRGAPAAEADPPAAGTPPAAPPPGDKARERRRRRAAEGTPPDSLGEDPGMAEPPPLSEGARSWARVCIDRLLGDDPAVRRSASDALRALGAGVVPLLREARQGADEGGRSVLDEVARSLEKPKPKAKEPGKDAPPRGRAVLERVRTDLGLDPEKARAVGAKLLPFGRTMRETMQDARDGLVSYEDAKAKGDALRAKLREDLKADLTEEQLAKLDGILDELAPGRKKAP